MTVVAVPLQSRLQLRINVGTDDQGKPILRTRTLNNVKPHAGHEALYLTGQELAALQIHTLEVIRRVDEMDLEEEE